MKNQLMNILILCGMLSVAACDNKDDDPVAPTTGNIYGFLVLVDEFGVTQNDHFGVRVTTQNNYYDISDNSGNYSVNNLAPGTYDLRYELAGYGTLKKYDIEVIPAANGGTTIIEDVDSLAPISSTIISALTAQLDPVDSTFTFTCNVSPLPGTNYPRAFRLFFGHDANVSVASYEFTPSKKCVTTTATATITGFERADFYKNGFNFGDTIYAVAYGETIVSSSYFDPVSNITIFPNLNESAPANVATVILP
ncbi:MAG: carboxypeptidase regulatory-like domain-containing protein [Bacteroidetes bacterium]|nr:carboxypeptidase regulatory-like domain-containing protein [Bacteroidota bacterium]